MKVDSEKIKKAKGRTYINVEDCPISICVNDYLEYKKIEEELGIDLITLFKALKNGIYGKIGNDIKHILAPHLSWYNREIYIFKIKDYEKTWALTKEELL